ncbi:indolepyruvate oxidoreductase subunit beta [Patescibacteria group bacterium]|nr:indolepyruvate oxidoreductase subunit beta [Patescibacteria group bacterium]MBU4367434.1 indolepyruvate oxidoreductase subunit beta [Patescibacteria group bacterium]MBU4461754.1 indolepyruvate oxidoreductase subunit beta [Patescibacteria group bacterium]MCG2700138.1 indolepyruvate oxidoreductase subunit beta [Candidatus Parcubacteria bacterium]
MVKNSFNIIIAGVGGQGLITLTQILAEAALSEGYDVKTSELHGLSQRGGSVETHIRFGKKIYSPLIDGKKADLVISLETQEGARKIPLSHSKTIFAVNNDYVLYRGGFSREKIEQKIKSLLKKRLYLIPASEICKKELQNGVVSGVYLLGYCIFKKIIPLKANSILKAIKKIVPIKYLELNKKAFNLVNRN